ncbi:MAG TPA: DinB family protein [Gemmatimonadales bacterium]|jgi:uncharacterized damage-inducible protein DinB
MIHSDEVETFLAVWNAEAQDTLRLLEILPPDQYDFRPDPNGRSIGEMAWHLSEIDACLSFGLALRRFRLEDEPPDLKRPREIRLLGPGYRRIHDQAVARLEGLTSDQLEDSVTFFDGRQLTIRHVLWNELLHHLIHHRAQLVLLCRMAGGAPPGFYGPNREEMEAIRANLVAAKA